MSTETGITQERASFIKRLAAMIYDTLVAVAIGLLSGLLINALLVGLIANGVLDNFGAATPSDSIQQSLLYTLIIQLWMTFWIVTFFLWFWKNGGQTIGMRAWRLRLFSLNDEPVTWGRLIIRMLCSLAGIGTLLVLFDRRNKLALQDRASGIEIRTLSKEANHHKNW